MIHSRNAISAREAFKANAEQEKINRITRVVALIFAFASVYYFFIKLLFL